MTRGSVTATGYPSAPEVAREAGEHPLDYLRDRGCIDASANEHPLRERMQDSIVFYLGIDPTAPSLHAGHMSGLMVMRTFQLMGHRPIPLIGGGTALIGDPSGKTSTREQASILTVARNANDLSAQLRRILSGGREARLYDNMTWWEGMGYIAFLRDIGRYFSVNEMLAIETYKTRIVKGGLNFVEFTYLLAQAYDYLELYQREGCVLQIGGSDQWSNILAGVDLVRRVEGATVSGLTFPLLTTSSGAKMGKTASGGTVWLDPALTSPYDYYQYWINVDDTDVVTLMRRMTFIPEHGIRALIDDDIREAKRALALEATAAVHGIEAAQDAERAGDAAFGSGDTSLIPTTVVSGDTTVADALVAARLAKGRNEVRRIAAQGGLRAGDRVVTDADRPVNDYTIVGEVVLRVGKKRVVRILAGEEE